MLAPRSHSVFEKYRNPMVLGIVKAPKFYFFCTKKPCGHSTTMLYPIIILRPYQSIFSIHIFYKLVITKHFFKSFYQRDIDGMLFQQSNNTSVFAIICLLHQYLQEWWWWSRKRDHLMGYLCFFHRYIYQLTIIFH